MEAAHSGTSTKSLEGDFLVDANEIVGVNGCHREDGVSRKANKAKASTARANAKAKDSKDSMDRTGTRARTRTRTRLNVGCGKRGHYSKDCWSKKNTKGGSKGKHKPKNADAHNLDSRPSIAEPEVEIDEFSMTYLDVDAL